MSSNSAGFQVGYSYFHFNQIEVGANYYWSFNPNWDSKASWSRMKTIGPFVCADFTYRKDQFYVGERAGINFAYLSYFSLRVSPAVEHLRKNDFYLGSDIGISFLGFFIYYGYYAPINNNSLPGFSKNRIGIRFVFNAAPVNTSGFTI